MWRWSWFNIRNEISDMLKKKIRFFFLKKKKRCLVNGVNEDGLNKDYLDTYKNELVTRLKT